MVWNFILQTVAITDIDDNMVRCPRCGKDVPALVASTGLCYNCTRELAAPPVPSLRKKILGEVKEVNWITFVVSLGVLALYIFWISPFFSLISGLLALLFKAIPAGYILAGPVSLVIAYILILVIAYKLSQLGFLSGLIVLALGIIIAQITYSAVAPIFMPGGWLGGEAEFLACLFETGFDFQQCGFITAATAEKPVTQKIGPKELISLSFGAPDVPFPLVRYNEPYEFPVTIAGYTEEIIRVEPLDYDTDPVHEVYIENETGFIELYTDTKSLEVSKDLPPAVVAYTTKGEKILKREGTYTEVLVKARYSYNAIGTNDFVVARDRASVPREIEDCVNPLLKRPLGKPCSFEGPLDLVIYFTPFPFYHGDGKRNTTMLVSIENKGDGSAKLLDFSIERLTEAGIPTFEKKCTDAYKKFREKWLHEDESITFSCSFELEKGSEVPSRQGKFQARLEYEYIKTIKKELRVFEQLKKELK